MVKSCFKKYLTSILIQCFQQMGVWICLKLCPTPGETLLMFSLISIVEVHWNGFQSERLKSLPYHKDILTSTGFVILPWTWNPGYFMDQDIL